MPKGSFDLKAWARIGAEQRLTVIREEMRRIHAAFPDLRDGRIAAALERAGRPKRKKRTMSAEARAKIAAAQRKRWAKIRRAT
jgi:hypothetical protein